MRSMVYSINEWPKMGCLLSSSRVYRCRWYIRLTNGQRWWFLSTTQKNVNCSISKIMIFQWVFWEWFSVWYVPSLYAYVGLLVQHFKQMISTAGMISTTIMVCTKYLRRWHTMYVKECYNDRIIDFRHSLY